MASALCLEKQAGERREGKSVSPSDHLLSCCPRGEKSQRKDLLKAGRAPSSGPDTTTCPLNRHCEERGSCLPHSRERQSVSPVQASCRGPGMTGKGLCHRLVFLSPPTSLVRSERSQFAPEVQAPCTLVLTSNAGDGMPCHCGVLTPWHNVGLFLLCCPDLEM